MIVMRAERLATAVPLSGLEGDLRRQNAELRSRVALAERENAALKSRLLELEAEIARFRGGGMMIPLEAFAALAGIIRAAALVGGATVEELKGPRRRKPLCLLRQAAMYVAYRDVGRLSYPQIARHFGDRDHTTAMHAVTRIQRDIDAGVAATSELLDDIRRGAGIAERPR